MNQQTLLLGQKLIEMIEVLDLPPLLWTRLMLALRANIEDMMRIAHSPEVHAVPFVVDFPVVTNSEHKAMEAFEAVHQVIRSNMVQELAADPSLATKFLDLFPDAQN